MMNVARQHRDWHWSSYANVTCNQRATRTHRTGCAFVDQTRVSEARSVCVRVCSCICVNHLGMWHCLQFRRQSLPRVSTSLTPTQANELSSPSPSLVCFESRAQSTADARTRMLTPLWNMSTSISRYASAGGEGGKLWSKTQERQRPMSVGGLYQMRTHARTHTPEFFRGTGSVSWRILHAEHHPCSLALRHPHG